VIAADLKVRGALDIQFESLDILEPSTFSSIIDKATLFLGKIDIVLIAPGILPVQADCETDINQLIQQINLNGTYQIALAQLFANKLKDQQSGTLAVISSPAGDRGRQSNYIYGAAKGALSIFAQGARNSLNKKGVHVLVIKPSFVITPMTSEFDRSGPLWVKLEIIADAIVSAVDKKNNSIYAPKIWFFIMTIIKFIPETIFKRLSL
jgi:decaprenylphospho-beta-D-erythro-pentofuranosid-2-ulose 2-reductase